MQIQISWLLQKPTDLDLHCLQRQGISGFSRTRANPTYWDTLTSYRACPRICASSFHYLIICLNYCWMSGKQCRPWADIAFCGIWSGSTLFDQACLSQYLGLFQYLNFLVKKSALFGTMNKGPFRTLFILYIEVCLQSSVCIFGLTWQGLTEYVKSVQIFASIFYLFICVNSFFFCTYI